MFEEKDGDYQKGHTSNYIMVKVKTNENLENKVLTVKISQKEKLKLLGKIIN